MLITLAGINTSCAARSPRKPARPDAPTQVAAATKRTTEADHVIALIRDEGLNRSQVMDTLDYLCDVIGPRLTGSPACKRANEWTRDRLAEWKLDNAHLEPWGPFGRGWSLKRFSLQVVEPNTIVLNGYPKAWSPGFDSPFEAPVVLVDAQNEADLEKFKGKLCGAVVLVGKPREVQARFEPLASRLEESDMQRLASARPGTNSLMGQPRAQTASERQAQFAASGALGETLMNRGRGNVGRDSDASRPAGAGNASNSESNPGPTTESTTATTTTATTRPAGRSGRRRVTDPFASRALEFVAAEGAQLVITPSTQGDGGTFFVAAASIPGDNRGAGSARPATASASSTNPTTVAVADAPVAGSSIVPTTVATTLASETPTSLPTTGPTTRPRVWEIDAPTIPPQVTLAIEDFNRLARMIRRGESLMIAVDLQVQFHEQDPMAYNTVAEIPGVDPVLKDQIVMVGAHLDSWHSGTGATDNAVGAAAAMEAARIIRALDLKPRRTIRVALWTGEEQGIFGSTAYVKSHFGHDPDARGARDRARRADDPTNPADAPGAESATTQPTARRTGRNIVKAADYEKLSIYFNLDNGTGKIRGVYAQGNADAVPIFKRWFDPVADLGAKTVSASSTGSTDHIAFDQIGLPGFQFIQDPIEYRSRTHHSNHDVYDRIQADDIKQAATIMAAFVWQAAQMDERFPRKEIETRSGR
jgi:hypothetical protein